MTSLPETKVCTKCHEEKPLDTGFYRDKYAMYGFSNTCKNCKSLYQKERHASNAEALNAAARERRLADLDKTRAIEKKSYYKNRDSKIAYKKKRLQDPLIREADNAKRREFRKNNLELVRSRENQRYHVDPSKKLESHQRWVAKNLDKKRAIGRKGAITRRARKAGVESEKYTEQDIFNRWGYDCHICGEPIDLEAPRAAGVIGWERGLHLEHVIPLVAGGSDTIENVKPAHGLCNLRKSKSI